MIRGRVGATKVPIGVTVYIKGRNLYVISVHDRYTLKNILLYLNYGFRVR